MGFGAVWLKKNSTDMLETTDKNMQTDNEKRMYISVQEMCS
jgi:hypothetical protein